jgi:hypothetical protein
LSYIRASLSRTYSDSEQQAVIWLGFGSIWASTHKKSQQQYVSLISLSLTCRLSKRPLFFSDASCCLVSLSLTCRLSKRHLFFLDGSCCRRVRYLSHLLSTLNLSYSYQTGSGNVWTSFPLRGELEPFALNNWDEHCSLRTPRGLSGLSLTH